jgi:hypothetical protein
VGVLNPNHKAVEFATSLAFFANTPAQNDILSNVTPRSMGTRNPYGDAFELVSSQGFSPFGYDVVAPSGAQNDINGG